MNMPAEAVPIDPARQRAWRRVAMTITFLVLMAVIVPMYHMAQISGKRVGDGVHVETYGFDLSALDPEYRKRLAASGLSRDGQLVLDKVRTISIATAETRNHRTGSYIRFLVKDGPVIGVSVGDQHRAYPIRFMRVHEIVNDTLGDLPIAVTFSPLTQSAAVCGRRTDQGVRVFGYSGLLLDANLLLYDRSAKEPQALWSQLRHSAISGLAKDQSIAVLPMRFTTWGSWRDAHPNSTILDDHRDADPRLDSDIIKQRYRASAMRDVENYAVSYKRFPVAAAPKAQDDATERVVAEWVNGAWQLRVLNLTDESGDSASVPTMVAYRWAWASSRR